MKLTNVEKETIVNLSEAGPTANIYTHNEATKPSVLDSLRQCQEDAEKSQGGTTSPSRSPER